MQKTIPSNKFFLFAVICSLNGCATKEENLVSGADVYQTADKTQPVRSVKIIRVLPTKIEFDNSQAQFALGVSSAATRGIGGFYGGAGSLGTMGTTIDGGSIDNSTGLSAPDRVSVDGVSITYTFNENTITSSQAGRLCEFRPGVSILLTNDENQTRIKTNSSCPIEK